MTNLVQYGKYDPAKAKQEKQQMESGGDNNFMKLAAGRNIVRFLPPPPDHDSPFKIVQQHYIKIAGEDRPFVFTCPRSLAGGRKCPACAHSNELRSSGAPRDRNTAQEYSASKRVFCNVIDRADPDAGPKILAFGKMIHTELNKFAEGDEDNDDFEPVSFTDPLVGYDIAIKREGTGMDTKYKVILATKPTRLHAKVEVMNEWITKQHDLEKFNTMVSDEEILMAIEGVRPERQTRQLETRDNKRLGSGAAATKGKPKKKEDVVDADFDEVDADDFDGDDSDEFKDE